MQESCSKSDLHPKLSSILDLLATASPSPKLFTVLCNPLHSLGSFTSISASSLTASCLEQHLRSAVKVNMKETKNIYEGEVTELQVSSDQDIAVTLKTLRGSKRLRLSHTLAVVIDKERISVGDVVYIECNSGIVKRLGRSESFLQDCDIESERYIPLPKGEAFRAREIVQEMSLHDLDVANTKPSGGEEGLVLNTELREVKEVCGELQDEVDRIVKRYVEGGNCEVRSEVLVIEGGVLLSAECVRFLGFVSERKYCPIVFVTFEEGDEIDKDLYGAFVNVKLEQDEDLERIMARELQPEAVQSFRERICTIGHEHGIRQALKLVRIMKGSTDIDVAIDMLGLNK